MGSLNDLNKVWLAEDFTYRTFPVKEVDGNFTNSVGMHMVAIEPGSFKMGGGDIALRPDGLPVHMVSITKPFYISEEPVRTEVFCEFYKEVFQKEPDFQDYRGFVQSISWYEAAKFCDWLSQKEGVSCHLPTEAEWEYVARNARKYGVDRICDIYMREWCFDWYEEYNDPAQEDPAGPDSGLYKAVRGGYLDNPARYNEFPQEPWMRGALPPTYRHYDTDTNNTFGTHPIGFRVVYGEIPKTNGIHPSSYICQNVHQESGQFTNIAPNEKKPYFRKRYLFPSPPDNATSECIRGVGFPPTFRHHHHSPALEVAPNGDLLLSVYSTYHEYDAESGLVGARLRFGSDQWEMPDMFLNPVGVNDHAPSMFCDTDGTLYHFWGWQQLSDSFPFQYSYSKDNGATWSAVQFPLFSEKAERVVRQPVNTCIRAKDGTFYMTSDASDAPCSVLWRSKDNMATWENPKGRTAGRHSTAVELKDGSLLAMGGKNSNIDGYMPKAVSSDGGDTWTVEKTPFPMLNSGQRPCIIRLQSGKLFMCGDFQDKKGNRPADEKRYGCYGAWSEDEGETWSIKKLWGTQPTKKNNGEFAGEGTLGYSVCRQAPNGMIHVVTSNNQPLLHFEFNEEWLVHHEEEEPKGVDLMATNASKVVGEIHRMKEYYSNGQLRCEWGGAIADDGRFLLEGEEVSYYADGTLMSEASYHLGNRVGTYTMYNGDGTKKWKWEYPEKGIELFTSYFEDGDLVKCRSRFKNRMADGIAQTYERKGTVKTEMLFKNGEMVKKKDLKKEEPSPIGEIID